MPFHHRAAIIALLSLALGACQEDLTTTTGDPTTAPLFSASTNQFANFDPLPTSASCIVPPATLPGFATYQPFVLPSGYQQRIVADEMTDFAPVAGSGANLPDMNTLNEGGPHAGRYLYRTHETTSNGAVTVYDRVTGAVMLVDQQSHYERLDGIVWSPWNTLVFSEETGTAALKDPRAPNAVGGLVYEWDPRTGQSRPLPAVGPRSHEGLRFDAQGNLYGISESTPNGVNQSGAIFKFVPDRHGDLSSGQLYALKLDNPITRTGHAAWVALDRTVSQVNSDLAAVQAGATGWGRPEDIEIATSTGNGPGGPQILYVVSTSETLVLRVELQGDEAFVSNYVQEGVNVNGLQDPDNLALDSQGTLFILEDNGPGDIWAVPHSGTPELVASKVVRFASLSDCSAEPSGLYFDKTGRVAWIHVQHAGGALGNDLLVEITKP